MLCSAVDPLTWSFLEHVVLHMYYKHLQVFCFAAIWGILVPYFVKTIYNTKSLYIKYKYSFHLEDAFVQSNLQ